MPDMKIWRPRYDAWDAALRAWCKTGVAVKDAQLQRCIELGTYKYMEEACWSSLLAD